MSQTHTRRQAGHVAVGLAADLSEMQRRAISVLAFAGVIGLSACGPVPINDVVSPTKIVSTAPASIQLTMSTRPDQRLDLHADVLTAAGSPVAGVAVTFTVTSGSVDPATATTDVNGRAVTIASAPTQNTITATVGTLSDTQKLQGPPAPVLQNLTVTIPSLGTTRAGDPVEFGVSLSSAPGSTVRVVEWNFGDGSRLTANTFNPTHTYGSDGSYAVTIAVADDLGRTASASQRITVSTPAAVTPTPIQTTISVTIACTVVTPLRRSCTATPMVNGTAVASSLVSSMSIEWGDNTSEGLVPAAATSHTYPTGTLGTVTIKVYGTLTTGERFGGQTTIAVG